MDGAGEPKVEQWMRDAADELGNLDIDDFQKDALVECDRDEDRANALMLERLAGVIAKHAPKFAPDHFAGASKMVDPAPIRPGDVVQFTGRNFRGLVTIVTDVREDELVAGHLQFLAKHATRIGRAKYHADGNPVED